MDEAMWWMKYSRQARQAIASTIATITATDGTNGRGRLRTAGRVNRQ
jgi:hypothetical protein